MVGGLIDDTRAPTLQSEDPVSLFLNSSEVSRSTNDFDPLHIIGESWLGQVYRAWMFHTPVMLTRLSSLLPQAVRQELRTLAALQHPLFLTSFGLLTLSTGDACLAQELLPHGSLRDRLDRRQQSPPLPWLCRPKIAWQVSAALAHLAVICSREVRYMGSPFIVSSDDIFLGYQFDAKISLPEVLLNVAPGSDALPPEERCVLSLGLVMAEMLTGRTAKPCPAVLRETIIEKVPAGDQWTPTTQEEQEEMLAIVDAGVRASWPRQHCLRFAGVIRAAFAQNAASVLALEASLVSVLALPLETCVSCLSSATSAPLQCGHRCLCTLCTTHALEKGDGCPVCRAPINPKPNVVSKTFVPRSPVN